MLHRLKRSKFVVNGGLCTHAMILACKNFVNRQTVRGFGGTETVTIVHTLTDLKCKRFLL